MRFGLDMCFESYFMLWGSTSIHCLFAEVQTAHSFSTSAQLQFNMMKRPASVLEPVTIGTPTPKKRRTKLQRHGTEDSFASIATQDYPTSAGRSKNPLASSIVCLDCESVFAPDQRIGFVCNRCYGEKSRETSE